MDRYVLDTNVYIRALRDRSALIELHEFLSRAGARVRMEGIVAAELFAGAVSPAHADAVRELVVPYQSRGLTTSPSFTACAEAGRVIAALQNTGRGGRKAASVSLVRDALIAASCREADVVLITHNISDFQSIQRHMRGFRFLAPWPLASSPRPK